jgi:hypothetical protein
VGTTLRCTGKLLKGLRVTPREPDSPPDNRLGEWTANLIRVSRGQLVIAVSEPTRFAIVVEAAPYREIPVRLAGRLYESLCWIGVAETDAIDEARALRDALLARSNSRSVLGTLTDYALCAEHTLFDGAASSPLDLTRLFAKWVLLRPEPMHPGERVRAAFGLLPKLPAHAVDW